MLRRIQGRRQADVVAPGRNRRFVIRLENDDAGSLRLDDIGAHFSGLDAGTRHWSREHWAY